MSEFEKKVIDEMDAADVVTAAQEADRKRVVPVEHQAAEQTEGRDAGDWVREMMEKFDGDARAWHHRQGWEAFMMACYHGIVVLACAGGLLCGRRELVLTGIAAASLMMLGGWLHKAKAGWSV